MLFSYPNVWNTSLLILQVREYRLFVLSDDDDYDAVRCVWCAEKDGIRLKGDNPIELLGLAAIQEHLCPAEVKPYWWRIDGPNLVAELKAEWKRKLLAAREQSPEEEP
jgi:hypothetical protein